MIGLKLGDYRILEELGRGGMGVVYLAEQIHMGSHHAIKVLPEEFAHNREFVARFKTEAQLMFRLRHANIVSVTDMGFDQGCYYLVMDYIAGPYGIHETLADILKEQGGTLWPEQVALYGIQACEALEFAHREGIVHRDIKPANILLDIKGNIRIADFGLAKITGTGASGETIDRTVAKTVTGAVLGTYDYMSPEQRQGREVDHRSDIYSLGMTLFELLTGRRPGGVMESYQNYGISIEWYKMLRRCLEQDPAARFQKIGEVQKVLERLITQPRVEEHQGRRFKWKSFTTCCLVISISLGFVKSSLSDVLNRVESIMQSPDLSVFSFFFRLNRVFLKLLDHIPLFLLLLLFIPALLLGAAKLDYIDWENKVRSAPGKLRPILLPLSFGLTFALLVNFFFLATFSFPSWRNGPWRLSPGVSPVPGSAQVRAQSSSQLENSGKSESWQVQGNEAVLTLPGGVTMVFVKIPAGRFKMGSSPGIFKMGSSDGIFREIGRDKDEGPQHRVTISRDFWMGKYEVTQAQWQAVMGSNPSRWKGNNLPVEHVSWNDCQEFLQKLNLRVPNANFRLPSEAEWEYACRAGIAARFYFGDNSGQLGDYAWYGSNSGSQTYGQTHPVGQKRPNAWGLCDMHGNVSEWCEDVYHDSYHGAPSDGSAWAGGQSHCVIRGGSFGSEPWECRSAHRYWCGPDDRGDYLGFRLTRTP